eukprot:XP_001704649.1 Hypothetical protein GL50803_20214 [Giardia lamblia ATCC 50803]
MHLCEKLYDFANYQLIIIILLVTCASILSVCTLLYATLTLRVEEGRPGCIAVQIRGDITHIAWARLLYFAVHVGLVIHSFSTLVKHTHRRLVERVCIGYNMLPSGWSLDKCVNA